MVCEVVDSVKDDVCWSVLASAFPPAFDDTAIISVNLELVSGGCSCQDGSNEKFKTDGFCPTNLSAI
jgi:hypothetical protein